MQSDQVDIGSENASQSQQSRYEHQLQENFRITESEMKAFVNQATDKNGATPSLFQCFLCLQLAYDPKVCGECNSAILCRICYQQYDNQKENQQNDLRCQCGKDFDPKVLIVILKNCLDKEIVVCRQTGCPRKEEELTYKDLLRHAQDCITKNNLCPLGCKTTVTSYDDGLLHFQTCDRAFVECQKCKDVYERQDEQSHLEICPKETTECPLCNVSYIREEMDAHLRESCSESEVDCQKCLEQYKRKFEQQHLDTCPETVTQCSQCDYSLKRKDLDSHNCMKTFMTMLTMQQTKIQNLEQQNQVLSEENKDLKEKVSCLEAQHERGLTTNYILQKFMKNSKNLFAVSISTRYQFKQALPLHDAIVNEEIQKEIRKIELKRYYKMNFPWLQIDKYQIMGRGRMKRRDREREGRDGQPRGLQYRELPKAQKKMLEQRMFEGYQKKNKMRQEQELIQHRIRQRLSEQKELLENDALYEEKNEVKEDHKQQRPSQKYGKFGKHQPSRRQGLYQAFENMNV